LFLVCCKDYVLTIVSIFLKINIFTRGFEIYVFEGEAVVCGACGMVSGFLLAELHITTSAFFGCSSFWLLLQVFSGCFLGYSGACFWGFSGGSNIFLDYFPAFCDSRICFCYCCLRQICFVGRQWRFCFLYCFVVPCVGGFYASICLLARG